MEPHALNNGRVGVGSVCVGTAQDINCAASQRVRAPFVDDGPPFSEKMFDAVSSTVAVAGAVGCLGLCPALSAVQLGELLAQPL